MMHRRRISFAFAGLYCAVILFCRLPDHLILFPTKAPIDARGAVRKTIPFENGQLELWTAKSQLAQTNGRADTYVLRFYGNADRADRWVAAEAEMWNGRAVEVWGMNYPGFGGSTGPARLSHIGPAALTAFDELQRQAGKNAVESAVPSGKFATDALRTAHTTAPVVLFGASLGATAALRVAANRPVAGLILHNPPPLRQMILRQFGWWNAWLLAGPVALQIPRDLDSIDKAKRIHAPAIFLLAENDEMVAPRFHRLVVDAYAGEKRVIRLRGARHNDPIEGAALSDFYDALDWLLPEPTLHTP
jgi:pimeloyl-ACP methyl ester carboxylesterase